MAYGDSYMNFRGNILLTSLDNFRSIGNLLIQISLFNISQYFSLVSS